MLPNPPKMTMANAFDRGQIAHAGVTRKTGPKSAPAAAASAEPIANVAV